MRSHHPASQACVWFIIWWMFLPAEMARVTVSAWVNVQQQINRQTGPFAKIIHDQTFSFMPLTCVLGHKDEASRPPSICLPPAIIIIFCLFSGLVDSICIGIGHGDTLLAVWLGCCFSGQRFQAPSLTQP